jgi:hypothetical protein
MTFSVDDATPATFWESNEMTYSSCRSMLDWKEKCWSVTGGFGDAWKRRWDK